MLLQVVGKTSGSVSGFNVCPSENFVVRCDVEDCLGLVPCQLGRCPRGDRAIPTSGSMAAALGRKNVGERVWWFTRDSLVAPVKWPRRPDNLDFAQDIVCSGEERGGGEKREKSDADEGGSIAKGENKGEGKRRRRSCSGCA